MEQHTEISPVAILKQARDQIIEKHWTQMGFVDGPIFNTEFGVYREVHGHPERLQELIGQGLQACALGAVRLVRLAENGSIDVRDTILASLWNDEAYHKAVMALAIIADATGVGGVSFINEKLDEYDNEELALSMFRTGALEPRIWSMNDDVSTTVDDILVLFDKAITMLQSKQGAAAIEYLYCCVQLREVV